LAAFVQDRAPTRPSSYLAKVLTKARKLSERHEYENALSLLRALAKEPSLQRTDVEKVSRRIDRIHTRKEANKRLAENDVRRAKALFAKQKYQDAYQLLQAIPEILRSREARQLSREAADAMDLIRELVAQIRLDYKRPRLSAAAKKLSQLVALQSHNSFAAAMALRLKKALIRSAKARLRNGDHHGATQHLNWIPAEDRDDDVCRLLRLASQGTRHFACILKKDELAADSMSDDGVRDDGVRDDGVRDDGVRDDGVPDDGVPDEAGAGSSEESANDIRPLPGDQPPLIVTETPRITAAPSRRIANHRISIAEPNRDSKQSTCPTKPEQSPQVNVVAGPPAVAVEPPSKQVTRNKQDAIVKRKAVPTDVDDANRRRKTPARRVASSLSGGIGQLIGSSFKQRTAPFAVAVYGHIVLLLVLLRCMLSPPVADEPALILAASFTEPDTAAEIPFEVIPPPVSEEIEPTEEIESEQFDPEEVAMEDAPLEVAVPVLDMLADSAIDTATPVAVQGTASEDSTSTGRRSQKSNGSERPEPKPLVGPPHAVIDGNFAVWASPPNPRPGQSYAIYIRIRLPDRIHEYRRNDLSGFLVGTDGYRKSLGSERDDLVPLVDNTVTMAIPVVAANVVVADTILIRTKYLRQQKAIRLIYDHTR